MIKTIYVVVACHGDYDSYTERNVKAFTSESVANAVATQMETVGKELTKKFLDAFIAKKAGKKVDFLRHDHPLDPRFDSNGTSYEVYPLELDMVS